MDDAGSFLLKELSVLSQLELETTLWRAEAKLTPEANFRWGPAKKSSSWTNCVTKWRCQRKRWIGLPGWSQQDLPTRTCDKPDTVIKAPVCLCSRIQSPPFFKNDWSFYSILINVLWQRLLVSPVNCWLWPLVFLCFLMTRKRSRKPGKLKRKECRWCHVQVTQVLCRPPKVFLFHPVFFFHQ